jgi:hypothetical protein
MLPLNPVQVTFEDVEKLIRKICRAYWLRYGGEFEDYLGEAHLLFMDAYETCDHRRFTTWVYCKVFWGLRQFVRHRKRDWKQVSITVDAADRVQSDFILGEFLTRLSEDAREVVMAALDAPMEVKMALKRVRSKDPYHYRVAIKDFLRLMGWSVKRIRESFKEVQEALHDG